MPERRNSIANALESRLSCTNPSIWCDDNAIVTSKSRIHYIDVIMTTIASQITSLTVVYSTVYSDADQRKHQSSASLAFVWGIHRDQLRGKCFHLMTSSWRISNVEIFFPLIVLPCKHFTKQWSGTGSRWISKRRRWGNLGTRLARGAKYALRL